MHLPEVHNNQIGGLSKEKKHILFLAMQKISDGGFHTTKNGYLAIC
jgi:hypothetical protein